MRFPQGRALVCAPRLFIGAFDQCVGGQRAAEAWVRRIDSISRFRQRSPPTPLFGGVVSHETVELWRQRARLGGDEAWATFVCHRCTFGVMQMGRRQTEEVWPVPGCCYLRLVAQTQRPFFLWWCVCVWGGGDFWRPWTACGGPEVKRRRRARRHGRGSDQSWFGPASPRGIRVSVQQAHAGFGLRE